MLVTQTTLVGYTIINGTWSIQFALLIASIFNYQIFPDVFDLHYFSDANLTQSQIDRFNNTRRFGLPMIHGALTIINFVTNNPRINLDCGKQFFSFGGMLIMILLIQEITNIMYVFPQPIDWIHAPYQAVGCYIWLELEWMIFSATLISNVVFIMVRSCVRHKIQLDQVPERKQLPNVDTIIAIKEVVDAFCAQLVPFFVSMLIFFQPNGTNTGQLFWQLELILVSNLLSVAAISFLVFVHWKKGPRWWKAISHKVFTVLLLTNYIFIPGTNILVSFIFIFNPSVDLKQEPVESYVVFFMVICFSRVLEYFTLIRKTVIMDAKIFLQNEA